VIAAELGSLRADIDMETLEQHRLRAALAELEGKLA